VIRNAPSKLRDLLESTVQLVAIASGLELKPLEATGEYYYDEREVKRWITDGDPCEFCEEMEALGWIDMDDVFPTDSQFGDVDEPPAHNNCECEVEYKTQRFRVYAAARMPLDGERVREASDEEIQAVVDSAIEVAVLALIAA